MNAAFPERQNGKMVQGQEGKVAISLFTHLPLAKYKFLFAFCTVQTFFIPSQNPQKLFEQFYRAAIPYPLSKCRAFLGSKVSARVYSRIAER